MLEPDFQRLDDGLKQALAALPGSFAKELPPKYQTTYNYLIRYLEFFQAKARRHREALQSENLLK